MPGAAPTHGDDTRDQVWMLPAGGGEPVRLTDEPLGVSEMKLAPRGDRLVVLAGVLPGVAHEEQRARAADIAKHGPLQYRRMPVRHWDPWIQPAAPHYIAYDENGSDCRDLTPHADREHRAVEWRSRWDLAPDRPDRL